MTDEKKTQNAPIDYNAEYRMFMRCPTCNRKCDGIDDFRSIKTRRITKTCIKCRSSVYKSLKKIMDKPEYKAKKKLTLRQQLAVFKQVIDIVGLTTLTSRLNEHESLKTSLIGIFNKGQCVGMPKNGFKMLKPA